MMTFRKTRQPKRRRKPGFVADPHNELVDPDFDQIEDAEREYVQRYRQPKDE